MYTNKSAAKIRNAAAITNKSSGARILITATPDQTTGMKISVGKN
jgi:hypothetical protein